MGIEEVFNYFELPIIQAEKSGEILFISKEAKQLLQIEGKSKSSNLSELHILFDRDIIKNQVELIKGGTEKTYRIKRVDKLGYIFIMLEDISLEKNLKFENGILKDIIEHIGDGVQISNDKDVMVLYNKACENIEGIKRENCIGKKCSEIYIETENTEQNSIHRFVLKSGIPVIEKYNQYDTIEGKTVNVITNTYPHYEEGKCVAVYSIIKDITKIKEMAQENMKLQKQLIGQKNSKGQKNGTRFTFEDMVGEDKKFKEVIEVAQKISARNLAVLIYGETGTGKELFAQSIHNESLFMSGPFVAINCAAIPDSLLEGILFGTVKGAFTNANNTKGLFEQAENGTIFLDEINSMGINLQAKLLRVLQEKTIRRIGDSVEREINCRVISSINKDPFECIKNNQLREDLYYRLSGITLYIPLLRERKVDISTLIKYFIYRYNNQYGTKVTAVSKELEDAFLSYQWPGNVRELEHVIESCMNIVDIDSNILSSENLPRYLKARFSFKQSINKNKIESDKPLAEILEDVERQVIMDKLKENNGNVSLTAKELGLIRQSLQYRMRKFGISMCNVF